MKKFEFSLETLLRFNESLEKEQKNQLLMIDRRLHDLKMEIEDVITRKNSYITLYRNGLQQGIPIDTICQFNDFFRILDEKAADIRKAMSKVELEKEEKRQQLGETLKQKKMLENLKDKKYQKFLQDNRVEEQKDLDDLTVYRWSSGLPAGV